MTQRYSHIGDAQLAAAVSGLEATDKKLADVIELKTVPADTADTGHKI